MDNPEKMTTVMYTRHRMKISKAQTHNTETYNDGQHGHHQSLGVTPGAWERQASCLLLKLSHRSGTAYPSGAPEFIPGFKWCSYYSIFSFICMFCWSLFVLLYFFILAIVLRYTDSDFSFGIFKHVFNYYFIRA